VRFLEDDIKELSENVPNVEAAFAVVGPPGTSEISLALLPVGQQARASTVSERW
jgi:hypothetical protein